MNFRQKSPELRNAFRAILFWFAGESCKKRGGLSAGTDKPTSFWQLVAQNKTQRVEGHFVTQGNRGAILVYLIIFIAVFAMVMLAVVGNFAAKLQLLRTTIEREQAFHIAEAGINYYQWHLIMFSEDYQDGTGGSGPYVHDYVDYDTQETIGQFSLVITPPSQGGTAVTIQSTGWKNDKPNIKRTVTATYAFPSLASYALLTHGWMYAWGTESYSGPVHSDTGIRFEGTTSSSVTSSVDTTYTSDCNQEYPQANCPTTSTRDAIWAIGPNKPQSSPFWSNPTTKADFTGISVAFSEIQSNSQLGNNINLSLSNKLGYSLVFNSNGSVTVYKVLSTKNTGARFPVTKALSGGTDTGLAYIIGGTDYDNSNICSNPSCSGCGSKARCFQYTKTIPSGGMVIYALENLWVEGTVKGRVTVATANGNANTNPNASGITNNLMPNIYIANNIRYSNGEGGVSGENADTLGLMAEGNIIVPKGAPDPLYVDVALLAQNGFIAAPICYSGGSAKNNVYFFGSLILNGSWWFNFTNICGSSFTDGYRYPHFQWDTNLLYYPPPYFPPSSVSAGFQMVKWSSN